MTTAVKSRMRLNDVLRMILLWEFVVDMGLDH